ncbi:MAG: tandem-95 repeat protein, partial [Pararhodobacter sp.]|nr:tandem-95 repeat protein [Pararhodobacter sp.]
PAPVDPDPVDPDPADPAPVGPDPVDPAPADPVPGDPDPVDPDPTDPAPVGPDPVEPAPADPAPGDPDIPANAPPVIAPLAALQGVEDTFLNVSLPAAAFSDPDGDALSIAVTAADGGPLPEWLAFNPDSLSLTGQPPRDFYGVIALRAVADDGADQSARNFQLIIAGVNDAPIAGDDVIHGVEDVPTVIPLSLLLANDTDVDGDVLRIVEFLPGPDVALTLDGMGNVIATLPQDAHGTFTFDYIVSDGELTDTARVTLIIAPVNDAPRIAPLSPLESPEDTRFAFSLPEDVATDPDGDALILTLERAGGGALPDWIAFDAETRTISGLPPQDFNGTVALQLTAFDGALADSRSFDLIITPVNDAPRLSAPLSDRFTAEDQPFDMALQTGLFFDPDGDALLFELTTADGGGLPGWMQFDPVSGRLSGLPPQDWHGILNLRLSASDGEFTTSDVFRFVVTPVNDAPIIANPLPDWPREGSLHAGIGFELSVPDSTFHDPDGDALTLSAALADGNALPDWMQFDGSTLRALPPRDAAGIWDVAITATDGLAAVTDSFILTVAQPLPIPLGGRLIDGNGRPLEGALVVFTHTEGGAVGTFSDIDGVFMFGFDDPAQGYLQAIRPHMAGDAAVTARDALEILRMAVGLAPSFGEVDPLHYIAADINRDGHVTAQDALEVLRYAAGLPSEHVPHWVFLDAGTDLAALGLDHADSHVDTTLAIDPFDTPRLQDLTGVLLGSLQEFG